MAIIRLKEGRLRILRHLIPVCPEHLLPSLTVEEVEDLVEAKENNGDYQRHDELQDLPPK